MLPIKVLLPYASESLGKKSHGALPRKHASALNFWLLSASKMRQCFSRDGSHQLRKLGHSTSLNQLESRR